MHREPDLSDYVTAKEAASRLNVDVMTIYRWAKRRKIGSSRFGRVILIPLAEVERIESDRTAENSRSETTVAAQA